MLTRQQRDKWAEELESGRWTQSRRSLRDAEGYCCLGVFVAAVLQREVAIGNEGYPDGVLDSRTIEDFILLNDDEKLAFPEIAKHVRALPVSDE